MLLSRLFLFGLILALPILILGGSNASSAEASTSQQAPIPVFNRTASLQAAMSVTRNLGSSVGQKDNSSVDGGFTPTSTLTTTPTPTRTNTTGPTATPTLCGVNSNYAIATGTATIVAGTFDIGNHTDEGTTLVNLPFPFRLYDQSFMSVNLSPNGTAEFNSAIGEYQNQCLPSALIPTYSIYLNWDDQVTYTAGSGIYTSVTGVAPNRIYNIEWRTNYFDGGEANYELRLYEASATGRFDVIFGLIGNGNSNATSGVQKDNTLYTQWFCNGVGGVPTIGRLLTYTQVACGSVTPSPTRTTTSTNTPIVLTNTPTRTNTAAATNTSTNTSTVVATNTSTSTPVGPTSTPTRTQTHTAVPTATNTSTNTLVPTSTSTSTNTPVPPTSTSTATNTPTSTSTSTPTNTNTPLPTQTSGGFTATPVPTNTITNTPLPPTATATATNTNVPSTSTRTNTSVPATATRTNTPVLATSTSASTSTPLPTNTSGSGSTSTSTSAPTNTTVAATPTSTVCTLQFTDVPVDHTFYASIRCLACRGIINGYNSGCDTGNPCFRPGTNVTRAQLAKIVSNSAGFAEPGGAQQFTDVPPSSTFFDFIWRLASRGYIAGYPCGGPGEPCDTANRPYFRPNAFITRGQIS
ncbi:MAG: S-layer homology domain-containing protein, partial [Chloroflexia bacterium]